MSKVVGIDLGTTNSVIACMVGGKTEIVTNSEGTRTTPSVVGFSKDGSRIIGEPAKRQAVTNPDRTISSIKRHMGEPSYKVNIDGKGYTPQEISAMILSKLKKDAEDFLGETITEAIITCPAYFDNSQRQATKDAGKIAGLNVLRVINEPTAAALAYGLSESDKNQKVLVYDLGGGTFDVSIIDIGDGVLEVMSTNGDTHCGGDDVDNLVMNWLYSEFKTSSGVDLSTDKMAAQRVKEAAEKAKKELSSTTTTNVNLPFITVTSSGPLHMDITLTKAKFEELISDFVDKTMIPIDNALNDAGLTKDKIDRILLVGGSSRIPLVQQKLKDYMGMEPSKILNPDECVAEGAAIQAAKMSGDSTASDLLLLDVTPLSLNITTLGDVATTLIPRNTTIPVSKSQVFSTAEDNQQNVNIQVTQGERKFAKDNKVLGEFVLSGIPPAMRGVPKIEVTFAIDSNGITKVTAKDLGTGKEQAVTITSDTNMSDAEIERAVADANMYAEEDRKKKERIDAKNDAESTAYQLQKTLNDLGDKVSASQKESIEAKISEIKEICARNIDDGDVSRLKTLKEELMTDFQNVSNGVYSNSGNTAPNDDVMDGDYTEI